MDKQRDLEQERQQLLRDIEAALSTEVQESLQAACQPPQEPKVVLSMNGVGSEYANQR